LGNLNSGSFYFTSIFGFFLEPTDQSARITPESGKPPYGSDLKRRGSEMKDAANYKKKGISLAGERNTLS